MWKKKPEKCPSCNNDGVISQSEVSYQDSQVSLRKKEKVESQMSLIMRNTNKMSLKTKVLYHIEGFLYNTGGGEYYSTPVPTKSYEAIQGFWHEVNPQLGKLGNGIVITGDDDRVKERPDFPKVSFPDVVYRRDDSLEELMIYFGIKTINEIILKNGDVLGEIKCGDTKAEDRKRSRTNSTESESLNVEEVNAKKRRPPWVDGRPPCYSFHFCFYCSYKGNTQGSKTYTSKCSRCNNEETIGELEYENETLTQGDLDDAEQKIRENLSDCGKDFNDPAYVTHLLLKEEGEIESSGDDDDNDDLSSGNSTASDSEDVKKFKAPPKPNMSMYEEIAEIYRQFVIEATKWRGGDDPIDYYNEYFTNVVGRSWLGEDDGEQTITIQRRDEVAFDEKMLDDLKPYIEKVDEELQEASDKYDKAFSCVTNDVENFSSQSIPDFELNPTVIFDDRSWFFKMGKKRRLLGTIEVFNNGRNDDYKSKYIEDDKLTGAIGFTMELGSSTDGFNLQWEKDEDLILERKEVAGSKGDTYSLVTYDVCPESVTICSCPGFKYRATCKHVLDYKKDEK